MLNQVPLVGCTREAGRPVSSFLIQENGSCKMTIEEPAAGPTPQEPYQALAGS